MSQVFKETPPYSCLQNMIELFGFKQGKEYMIDYVTYKKILFHKIQNDWLEEIIPYYHFSKQFYATREFTFNSFITIIRQLCKIHKRNYRYTYDRNQNYKHLKYFITL